MYCWFVSNMDKLFPQTKYICYSYGVSLSSALHHQENKWLSVSVCLPACLFIHLLQTAIYLPLSMTWFLQIAQQLKKYITTASLVSSKIIVQPFYPLTFFLRFVQISLIINQDFFKWQTKMLFFFTNCYFMFMWDYCMGVKGRLRIIPLNTSERD